MEKSKYSTKSETESVFSVFNTFQKDAVNNLSTSTDGTVTSIEPVLTMSCLGQLGRFGNQLFQYAFLRICAENSGSRVECPSWIGQTLFGHQDAPISQRLPPAIEHLALRESLFDIIPEFIPYLEKIADAKSCRVDSEALEHGITNIEFYIDFFILSNCDVVCISNSNFSFIACMLNEQGRIFVRPHWDFSTKFTVFDPWNSEPLLWLGDNQTNFFKNFLDILYVTYVTQGMRAMLKCIFIYLPKSQLKVWGLRVYFAYQVQGIIGVFRSFLYTLGWRFM